MSSKTSSSPSGYYRLTKFLEQEMQMSHIYQPLLIKTLVDSGGSATLRQLAQAFLAQDESQLIYYEKRIKEMPLKVLKNRGIVDSNGKLVSLNADSLSLEQRAHIRMVCEQKLQAFVQKRGLGIWDYRLLEDDPVPDSLRYQVLKSCEGHCALCGASKDERPLDVDHIIPRSRGGKNELWNLQALCSKCNRSKQNLDATDFRNSVGPERIPDCLFCSAEISARAIAANGTVVAIEDKHPVTKRHTLIIPSSHRTDWFSMSEAERRHADELLRVLQNKIRGEDPKVTGFNIGMNCGESAGQTIGHAHIHLIPRRDGDSAAPRGGVRGVIPAKQDY